MHVHRFIEQVARRRLQRLLNLPLRMDVVSSRAGVQNDTAIASSFVGVLAREASDREDTGRKKKLEEGAPSVLPGRHERVVLWR